MIRLLLFQVRHSKSHAGFTVTNSDWFSGDVVLFMISSTLQCSCIIQHSDGQYC